MEQVFHTSVENIQEPFILVISWESADLRKRVPLPTDLARGISPPADSGFRDSLLCGRAKIILTIYLLKEIGNKNLYAIGY
jgi:hypothetical protein